MNSETVRSYIVKGVHWWSPSGPNHADFRVEDGLLKEVGQNLPHLNSKVIDGRNLIGMPAGVDAQVHLRVPGQEHKETPATGLMAALKGGYSAVLTMPNTNPTIDSVDVLKRARAEVESLERELGVTVFWSAAITKLLNSDILSPFEELSEAGVKAFTNDGLGVLSDEVMDRAFARLEKVGLPLLQHAEFLGHGGSLAPSSVQKKVNAKPYPAEPEWKMVERDLRLLKKYPKARYHVLHVSSAKTLELVRNAKRDGLNVTCEVTPHHLYFHAEQIDPNNKSFKMNPPIRSHEDQLALWEGLNDRTIDFVATDHAPHEKAMKSGDFDSCAFGTIGMETTLGVLIEGLRKHNLSPERLVEVFSSKPAQFLGLPRQFGALHTGERFHAILVDLEAPPREVLVDQFASLSKNSCFIGQKLPGRIRTAFHGELIHHLG